MSGCEKESEEAELDPEAMAVKRADEIYNLKYDKESNEVEAVKNLHAFLIEYKNCDNPALLWRLARACRNLSQLASTDTKAKKVLTYESFECAKRSLELDGENVDCHKWYAIALSDIGDYEATKQKISNAYEVQKHFLKAMDLDPQDPVCYHLLGMWCFTVADVPWYQKKIAAAIFETPPSSSYEEAIDYFERGERLDPNFYIMNQLMIGKAYLRLNKKDEARRWLEKVACSLRSLSRRPVPVFPAVLALSMFGWKKESEEVKPDPEAEAVKRADKIYSMTCDKEGNEVETVKILYNFLVEYENCNNPELLWRLARAARNLAQLASTDTKTKKVLTYEAFEFAKRSLELDGENFACHKWYAITLSDIGDYEGTKQKISNAYEIQKHFLKAIDLNPLDATCFHLLGMWCFTVADVPWYQQKIAAAIFETPPSSSYEEAIEYFERGERLDANFYSMNQLMIGKAYLRLNKKDEARRWLEKVCKYTGQTEEDQRAKTEAEELLEKC